MAIDFNALLNSSAPLSDVPPPKLIPAGTYIAVVGTHKVGTRKVNDEAVTVVDFPLAFQSVWTDDQGLSDIDDDVLEDFGGVEKLRQYNRMNKSVFMTEGEGEYNLAKFLTEVCGVGAEHPLKDALALARGARIGVKIKHILRRNAKPNDPQQTTAVIEREFALS